MFDVEIISAAEVAKIFHTTPSKITAAIKNGTLPIGFVADEKQNRTFIVKKRLNAYIEAKDLGA
mgnify:CR=1 FL=1|jgi:hypothetical protein|nr:MAG TPA_asm: Pyocin activator protein PrtN [Caudoviricetes sp.]